MRKQVKWLELGMLTLGAVLTGLTLVFPVLGFLEWISMIPLILAVYRLLSDGTFGLLRAYRYGFWTVFAYYIVIYHWFLDLYPLDFVGLDNASSVAVVVAGWVGLTLLQAIPGGLIFVVYRLLSNTALARRAPLLRPFLFAALWTVFEWSSTLAWTGVPWGRLALGQIDYLPVLQSASIFGSYFISFLILAVNGILAYMLLHWEKKRAILCGSLAGVLLLSNLGFGLIAMNVDYEEDETFRAAVVQGNLSSHDKWSANSTQLTKETFGGLTRAAAAEGAKLVVWPETIFPYALNNRSDIRQYLSDLARECDLTIAVGAFYLESREEKYNVLYFVDPDGTFREEYYAKRHLVPYGEYVPLKELISVVIPPLASLTNLGGDLTEGDETSLVESELGTIGSLICFDSIYERLMLDSVRDGAEIFVVSSNDSWFYDSAAVYQHQAQSQLRAIESGRYFVRSANTGISTIISPKGELLVWIDPLVEGYGVAEISAIEQDTVYSVIGNTLVYLCITFLAVLGGAEIVGRRKGKTKA